MTDAPDRPAAQEPPSRGWGPEAAPPDHDPGAPTVGEPPAPWGSAPPEGLAPPDPAVVAGPPWPALVAVGPYTPPRMIRWPIVAGLAAFAVWVVALLVVTSSTSVSHAAWLADHDNTINTLNHDQQDLAADNPASGGDAVRWLEDWTTFHRDVSSAASLPNPGGSATAPWREMINDYFNGSAEIIQAIETHDQALIPGAERNLQAGNRAAARFNAEMGINSP